MCCLATLVTCLKMDQIIPADLVRCAATLGLEYGEILELVANEVVFAVQRAADVVVWVGNLEVGHD